jgi:prepilin-type N-terminal cleavage/methylation domain-containing protein
MIRSRRAFTLIELLTVMAISAILLGLIVLPLFQSFNLTRAAQAFAEAQDRARILTDRVAREVGNSYSVRNGSGLVTTTVNGVATKVPQNALVVTLPNQARDKWMDVVLPFTKLDLTRPAEGDQTQAAANTFVDPNTGKIDPTLQSPKGQVVLPVAPGFGMIRYFIGRRDPFANYNNPYDGLLMAQAGGRDNLYVLYRAEVQPWVRRANKNSGDPATIRWRPNLTYFQSNDSTDPTLDDTQIVDIDDPRFFEPDRNPTTGAIIDDRATANTHANRIANWLAKAVVQTEVSRYDMILPVFDRRTRQVEFDANSVPRVMPLVQFRPERVSNDPATGQVAVRQGQESDTAEFSGPDVFRTQYGQWSNSIIRTFPQGWLPRQGNNFPNEYEVGLLSENAGEANQPAGFMVYGYDPDFAVADYLTGNLVPLFDVYTYQLSSTFKNSGDGRSYYPFTQAVLSANSLTPWLWGGTYKGMSSDTLRALFTPYSFSANRGQIVSSFDISEVGNPSATPPDPNNLPIWITDEETPRHPSGPYSPMNDPDLNGNFYDDEFRSINERFNKVANDYPSLLPNRVDRYLDLRVIPNSDGTLSPLFPNAPTGNQVTGFQYPTSDGGNRSKVQIVPGSEVVYGPDQLPGSNYGQEVRYTRVTTGEPGPNQYKINYADLQEPTNSEGEIDYSTVYDGISTAGFDPRVYDPTNVISAVLQPRYKVGYIKFNSDPNVPLPAGNVRVSYRFYFTGRRSGIAASRGGSKTANFAVDYDTRQLMSVLLTIRNYPQSSIPNPQTVTLKSTAAVRNYTR